MSGMAQCLRFVELRILKGCQANQPVSQSRRVTAGKHRTLGGEGNRTRLDKGLMEADL